MNRQTDYTQMEVVEHQWQVMVQPPGGRELQLERPLADTLQLLL